MLAKTDPGKYFLLYKNDSTGSLWGSNPGSLVEKYLFKNGEGVAYDLGCGDGRNLVWLARKGYKAVGFDVEPMAVERARARVDGANLDFRPLVLCRDVAILDKIEIADVIVAYGLLHCVPEESLLKVVDWINQHSRERTLLIVAVLTDGIDEPQGHGTSPLYLRGVEFYREIFGKDWDFCSFDVAKISEKHLPIIGEHTHEILRFCASRRA